jgi:hypothetical protein
MLSERDDAREQTGTLETTLGAEFGPRDPQPPHTPNAGAMPVPTRAATYSVYAVRLTVPDDVESVESVDVVSERKHDLYAARLIARGASLHHGLLRLHAPTDVLVTDDGVSLADLAAGRSNVVARFPVAA